jgi:hypothetical protein
MHECDKENQWRVTAALDRLEATHEDWAPMRKGDPGKLAITALVRQWVPVGNASLAGRNL